MILEALRTVDETITAAFKELVLATAYRIEAWHVEGENKGSGEEAMNI